MTTRVSLDSSGRQANDASWSPAISADGCLVAFSSNAFNLVADDTNGQPDVFLHDCRTGLTTRLSVDSSGKEANGWTYGFALSADGRFAAFESGADNLVPNDTNGHTDIFVHDRQTGSTTRVSVAASGAESNNGSSSPALSADGRFVAFESWASNLVPEDTNGQPDIFVHDRTTGAVALASVDSTGEQANYWSYQPAISADGRFVAYQSYASNLVADDSNTAYDIFVHDRLTGATTRVSVDSRGVQANAHSFEPDLSADGRLVVFHTAASNLVPGDTAVCEDPWGTHNCVDVFVHDRRTGTTTRISVDSLGVQGTTTPEERPCRPMVGSWPSRRRPPISYLAIPTRYRMCTSTPGSYAPWPASRLIQRAGKRMARPGLSPCRPTVASQRSRRKPTISSCWIQTA